MKTPCTCNSTARSTFSMSDWRRPLFSEAFDILKSCECHPGAVCRSAFALADAYNQVGDNPSAQNYHDLGETYRARIIDVASSTLGANPASYDRFVSIGFR